MKNRFLKTLTSLVLAILMVATLLPAMFIGTFAAEEATYVKTDLANIKATDEVIIVSTKGTAIYALSYSNGSSKAPAVVAVTIENDTIVTDAATAQIAWNIVDDGTGNLTIYPAGTTDTWLYCTNANNGVRVGTNENKTFVMDSASGYLKNTATSRYLGIYNNQDWRCYTNTTGNTAGQTFSFYVKQEAKHEHAYAWDGNVGTNNSHTLVCANTDGKCDVTSITEKCTWVDGFCSVCGAEAPDCAHPTTTEVAEIPATCTEVGYTAGVQCEVCNQYTEGHEEIPALGHTVVTDAAVAATCTETGLTEGSHCSVCSEVLVAQTVVDALGHNYENGVCTECDETQPTKLTIVKANFTGSAYAWNSWTATTTTGETISGYGYTYGGNTNIQLNGSKTGDYIYNTTALPGNIVSITLTKASGSDRTFDVLTSATPFDSASVASLKGQATDAKKTVTTEGVTWTFETNHKYFAIVLCDSSAAYLSSIEIAYEVCNHANTEIIPAVDATCTETGLTEGSKCSDCGEILVAQETIDALGHTDADNNSVCDVCGENLCTEHVWVDGEVIVEGDCTTDRVVEQICENCGEHGEDKTITAPGHTVVTDDAVAATCTETGLTEGSHCSECGEVLVAQTVVAALGHNYENGACTVCGAKAPVMVGDVVIFTGSKADGSETNELTGFASESAKYGDVAVYTGTPAGTFLLTVVEGYEAGTFAFMNGDSYITCKGEKNINLSTTLDAASSWNVYFDENGDLVIQSCSNDNLYLQYNSGSPRFTTYKNASQQPIQLVKYVAPSADAAGWSLSLKGDIGVNFYYNADWFAENQGAVITATINGEAVATYTASDLTANANGLYVVRCAVTPDQMSTAITWTVTVDGTVKSTKTVTVRDYINTVVDGKTAEDLGLTDEKFEQLKTLLTAMDAYGTATENYVGNVASDSADTTNLDGQEPDYVLTNSEEEGAISIDAASVTLGSTNSLNFFFTAAEGKTFADYTITVKLGDRTVLENASLADYAVDTDTIDLSVEGLAAYDLDTKVTVSITTDSTITSEISCSFMDYVYLQAQSTADNTLLNLLNAISGYSAAADAYFGK